MSRNVIVRKIIDSNFLQVDALRLYLSKSKRHNAVLTDYAAMEAYKGDTLASIFKSMEILSEFPRQVVILKGTQSVCALRGRLSGLQRRLVDEDQTLGFAQYCRQLHAAKEGDRRLQEQLLEHGRAATAHMNLMLTEVSPLADIVEKLGASYSSAELRALRKRESFTDSLFNKVVTHIFELALYLFRDHPRIAKLPPIAEVRNAFIFRYALCGYLLVLRWIEKGGPKNPERIRNDVVDMNFATFATYFDGLLTADKRCNDIYEEASAWLQYIFTAAKFGA